jgi:hypothetical protein
MSAIRSRPGDPNVRKSSKVGPSYPDGRFDVPMNADIDRPFGDERDTKTVQSEAGLQFEGGGAPLEKGRYNELWEGR